MSQRNLDFVKRQKGSSDQIVNYLKSVWKKYHK